MCVTVTHFGLSEGRAMSFRLTFISGPLQGTTTDVPADGLRIGRAEGNGLVIPDLTLSRSHCSLERRGDELWIVDNQGRNGTLVNAQRVSDRQVRPGDRVQIGESAFVVDTLTGEARAAIDLSMHDGVTLDLDPSTSRYLSGGDEASVVSPPGAEHGRVARDLRALLGFSHQLQRVRDRAVLHQLVLDVLVELFHGDLVALVLFHSGHAMFDVVQRPPRAAGAIPVSRTLVERVRSGRRAVLSNDVATDADFRAVRSVTSSPVRSVLCAPVVSGGESEGALYVASIRAGFFFGSDDLELITALSSIVGLALENIGHLEWLGSEATRERRDVAGGSHGLVGESAGIQDVARFITKVAPADSTVLVLGESGTGKELVARAIHRGSPRAARPFIALNCAALPENLVESELFGFEAGAFSDARRAKPGRLELANHGTLFLDEIGELSLPAQAKLLRAVQEHEVDRLGGTRPIRTNFRLVAATNRDLDKAARAGAFRDDLYHRLNVLSVKVPPLRERPSDIPVLAAHFLERLRGSSGRRIDGISGEARDCLMRYAWPGNVRELENVIERAVVLGCSDRILAEDLPETLLERPPAADAAETGRLHHALNEMKKKLVLEAFEIAGERFADAAKHLGVHPNHLHRLVRNLELRDEVTIRKRSMS
jgi:Nif-specific regulatory protein